jgi:dTDP-glucose pyrophosphorylase
LLKRRLNNASFTVPRVLLGQPVFDFLARTIPVRPGIMKSVILCAGDSTRASAITGGGNKCLTEIPGYGTILDYSLNTALGLTKDVIVLLGHMADQVCGYVGGYVREHPKSHVTFVEQQKRNGLCGALQCCEPFLGGKDFLLFLGDEIVTEPTHEKMMEIFYNDSAKGSVLALCGYVRAQNIDDIRKTYSIELSGNRVVYMVEKPPCPTNNLMGTGNCLFRNAIFDHIRKYVEKHGDSCKTQFSFPDVLQCAIDSGETVLACEIGKRYLNFNNASDIASFLHPNLG